VPILSLFVGAGLGAITFVALEAAGVSQGTANLVAGGWIPVAFVAIVAFAVRDYRRRAGINVQIYSDRIVVETDGKRRAVSLDDVRAVQMLPTGDRIACVLRLDNGQDLRLPDVIASFPVVREALEATLLPRLVGRLDEGVAQGQSIRLGGRRIAPWLWVPIGMAYIAVSILWFLTLYGFWMGTRALAAARMRLHAAFVDAKGGFVINQTGIETGGGEAIVWDQIQSVSVDEGGVVVTSNTGISVRASIFCEHCWPASLWLHGTFKTRASEEC